MTFRQLPGALWLGPGRAGSVAVCTRCRQPVTGAMTSEIEMDAFAEPELRETVLAQGEMLVLKLRRAINPTGSAVHGTSVPAGATGLYQVHMSV